MAQHIIAATWVSDVSETWRRHLLDRFRKQFEFDPASCAEIVFKADGKTFELGIFSSNNDEANYAFKQLEDRIRHRLLPISEGATIELRKIHGAMFRFVEDFKPKIFRQADYDTKQGREQYQNQNPIGRQTLFQLVKSDEVNGDLNLNMEDLSKYLNEAMTGVRLSPSTTRHYVGIGDGGLIVALSDDGDAILVWDGKEHIDISLFTEKEFQALPEKFVGHLLQQLERRMKIALRDDQPRGIGHVINFPSDIAKQVDT